MRETTSLLSEWIQDAAKCVVFSGAGMSTESGLPDFRSKSGMWQNESAAQLATVDALRGRREAFVSFYRWRIKKMKEHGPHPGHLILAEWESRGKIHRLITQNVDDYHERAGSADVLHLHGTLGTVHCHQCEQKKPNESFLTDDGLLCESCRGPMRPSVVLFGEPLPRKAWQMAEDAAVSADLFLVLGSSLQVSPANQLPLMAKQRGARLVIINLEPTPLDRYADLIVHESVQKTLRSIDHELND